MSTQKKFRGVLQPDNTALKWVIVKLPFDPVKAWPTRNRMRVKGTINGFHVPHVALWVRSERLLSAGQ